MKALRFLLRCLFAVAALAAVLILAVFLPPVQTWITQWALAQEPQWHARVGWCSAFWGRVGLSDLTMQLDRVTLVAPSVEARLPLWTAMRTRRADIRSVVAKGWTLDLTGQQARTATASAGAPVGDATATGPLPVAVHAAGRLARLLMTVVQLPDSASVAQVELEGDVFVPSSPNGDIAQVHVKLMGGPVAAGREAQFAVEAGVKQPTDSIRQASSRGRLIVATTTAGEIRAVRAHLDTSFTLASRPAEMSWTSDAVLARGVEGEACSFALMRAGRAVAQVEAKRAPSTSRLTGTWSVDLRAAELNALFAFAAPETLTMSGEGRLEAEPALARSLVEGHLSARGLPAAVIAPQLARAGLLSATLSFDLAHEGRFLRVNHCSGEAGIDRPVVAWQSVQPAEIDENDGAIRLIDPDTDWFEIEVRALPAAWLSAAGDRWRATAGELSGHLAARGTDHRMVVRTKAPLAIAGLAMRGASGPLMESLDGTVAGAAEFTPRQRELRLEPLTLACAGREVASLKAKLARPVGADQPATVTASWSADLDSLAAQPLNREGWIRGRTVRGEFAGTTRGWIDGDVSVALVGHDPTHTLSLQASVQAEPDGSLTMIAPVKIAFGADQSAFTAKVDWRRKSGRLQVDLTGERVFVAHLQALAGPVVATAAFYGPGDAASQVLVGSSERGQRPFWGGWVGRLDANLDQLNFDDREYVNVGGTFRFDHKSLNLEGGRGKLPLPKAAKVRRSMYDPAERDLEKRGPRQMPAGVSGTIAFDPTAAQPYQLSGTITREDVDAAPLFPPPREGADPAFEGLFAVDGAFTSQGASVQDLQSHLRQELRFRSTAGMVRLLTASISASLSQPKESAAGNALSGLGTAAGWLFGNGKAFAGSGEIRVSKVLDAVLDFRNSVREIGYDELTGTAVCEPDGSIRLVDFALTAKDERLTGSGAIGATADLALRDRPLSFTLEFGARGRIAGLLSTAGLLSSRNDAAGYVLLKQPVHFGGTLAAIDDREWRELLVNAATKPTDAKAR